MGRTGEHAGKQRLQTATGGIGEERIVGGVLVLAVIEGNGNRPSHNGPGINEDGSKMYTLNTTEVHGVVTRRNNELP